MTKQECLSQNPVILVRKKDQSWWLCNKALNKVTILDKFLILVIEELLDMAPATSVNWILNLGIIRSVWNQQTSRKQPFALMWALRMLSYVIRSHQCTFNLSSCDE